MIVDNRVSSACSRRFGCGAGDEESVAMPAMSGLMMMVWQSNGAMTGNDMHWLMIFAGVIAASMVAQAVGLMISALFAKKMLQKVEHLTDSFDQKTTPIMAKTNALLDDLGPKIRSMSTNMEQVSYTVREKCDELGETLSQINRTVSDANLKTRAQVSKVDDMVSEALATTAEVSAVVQDGIRKPVRQIAGIIAGLRAGLETLAAKSPFGKKRDFENPYDL
jgi:methyl-accepting chemotaxis protein